jgi:hypothetical protein
VGLRQSAFHASLLLGALVSASCQSTPSASSDGAAAMNPDGQASPSIQALVTNSSSLTPPALSAVIIWPTGQMSPMGVLYEVSAVDAVGTLPSQITLELASPPPPEVLSVITSAGYQIVMGNVAVVRAGALGGSSSGLINSCDVWGNADAVLIYFLSPGAWLSTELGNPNTMSYSQGYHLFSTGQPSGGPCTGSMMCIGGVPTLMELPSDTSLAINLRDPNTWCH